MGVGFAGHFGKGKHRSHLPVVCCDPYFLQLEVPVEDFKILDPHPTSFMGGLCKMNSSDLSLDFLIF